jgi:hypothetical protein
MFFLASAVAMEIFSAVVHIRIISIRNSTAVKFMSALFRCRVSGYTTDKNISIATAEAKKNM